MGEEKIFASDDCVHFRLISSFSYFSSYADPCCLFRPPFFEIKWTFSWLHLFILFHFFYKTHFFVFFCIPLTIFLSSLSVCVLQSRDSLDLHTKKYVHAIHFLLRTKSIKKKKKKKKRKTNKQKEKRDKNAIKWKKCSKWRQKKKKK